MLKEDAGEKEQNFCLCPYCKKKTEMIIQYECGISTWMICFCLCLITQCFFFIPLFSNKCKDIVHKCSQCKNEIKIKEFDFC